MSRQLIATTMLVLCGCAISPVEGEFIYVEVSNGGATPERYLLPVGLPDDQRVSISDLDEATARKILRGVAEHIKNTPLVYDGHELSDISINRVLRLPLGEIIIGFVHDDSHYSVQFDYENSHISHLSLNVVG